VQDHHQIKPLKSIRQKLVGLGLEAAAIRLALALKYNPYWQKQPRVPRGHPDGGQWTDGGATQVASLGPVILPVLKEGGKIALRVASQRARSYLMRLPKYWMSEELFPSKEEFDFETGRIGFPSNRRPDLDLVWYENFAEVKRFLGPAGDGMEWHHIVEKRTAKYGLFPIEFVNSTDNLIACRSKSIDALPRGCKADFLGLVRGSDMLSSLNLFHFNTILG